METFGDLVLLASILVALWYVPRYLWRVYGGPPIGAWVVRSLRGVMSRPERPLIADNTDRQTDRPSVSAVDPWLARLEVDRSKAVIIYVLVYSGWTTGEIRSVLKGDNGAIGLEVEAARQRLGIETPDNRTPIAKRPTDARFASDAG